MRLRLHLSARRRYTPAAGRAPPFPCPPARSPVRRRFFLSVHSTATHFSVERLSKAMAHACNTQIVQEKKNGHPPILLPSRPLKYLPYRKKWADDFVNCQIIDNYFACRNGEIGKIARKSRLPTKKWMGCSAARTSALHVRQAGEQQSLSSRLAASTGIAAPRLVSFRESQSSLQRVRLACARLRFSGLPLPFATTLRMPSLTVFVIVVYVSVDRSVFSATFRRLAGRICQSA